MKKIISDISEFNYFLSKAIYFDKPKESNWFVHYHQDLSISVDKKVDINGYSNWTHKNNQFGVQPPLKILEDTITVRIHLDDTNINNGALKIIPKSHLNAIILKGTNNWNLLDNEHICEVNSGSIMLMKPLLLHASSRTTNGKKRRVIHLEFNYHKLQEPLQWKEYFNF